MSAIESTICAAFVYLFNSFLGIVRPGGLRPPQAYKNCVKYLFLVDVLNSRRTTIQAAELLSAKASNTESFVKSVIPGFLKNLRLPN